jgi:F-type H+-transporting ATPase subunit b
MPQFHLDNFIPQLAWLTVFFAILYFGIVRATLPKIGQTIEVRETQVSGDVTTAERAKHDADALAADYASGIDAAHKAARTAIAEAKGKATASIEAAVARGNAVIAEKALVADADLAAARSKAMGEIETVAADAAADIVERLTGMRPTAATVADAARSALAA